MSDSITEAIRRALAAPAAHADGFDPHAHLRSVLQGVGLAPEDSGGAIQFIGQDPILPSVFRIASAAGIGLAAKSVAMAALWRHRGGAGQDIAMDLRRAPHRLCPFYDRKWELINGYPPRNTADPDSPFTLKFYQTSDARWVMPLNLYPRIKSSALRLLDCSDSEAAVAQAIRGWKARELEEACAQAGIVMPMLRSVEEFMEEPHYLEVLRDLPLIEIERIGDSAPEPFTPDPTQPLDGVRALGLARVIAGAGTGRTLALHGADVLNVWPPGDFESDLLYATANVGVRSALLDVADRENGGFARMQALLAGADVFYANRRQGYLERRGLSAQQAAAVRPGIVHASISLHGETGPWADRPGFDQTAGCVTGVMTLEGSPSQPKLPLIMVVNDYLGAWLLTTGIVAALMRRAREGGSYRVHVSLTRLSLWLYTLGLFDKAYAHATANSAEAHRYLDPEVFQAETPMGLYQGVTDQVRMSLTPGQYRQVLVPRGSSQAEWLPRV
ncbi:CoA transferase [Variovorax rhizosphaerae]|uniref:CoA transferase n=1 Tax=Variovorax rhizosphaerae TaxID=1836200 RepID=A0ABU8WH71_9BURK